MADLLPSTSDAVAADSGEPRVVGLDSEDADDLLSALSSATARELLAVLHDDPATPSALADAVDTSLQNTQYHLEKLEDADVVEVVDTAYSEKGREMNVYAPTGQPLVVLAGAEDEAGGLRAALARLLGGVGVVAAGSLAVQYLYGGGLSGLTGGAPGEGGAAGATPTPGADPGAILLDTPQVPLYEDGEYVLEGMNATNETVRTATPDAGAAAGADVLAGLPPGLVFFAGGTFVLAAAAVLWHLRTR